MDHRAQRHIVLVLVSCLLAGLVLTASAQMVTGPIEPGAGGWRPWVLASGQELRLAPPPDARATATELQELRTLAGQRDAAALERIRYWDFWSPAHRWNELLIETRVAQNLFGSDGLSRLRHAERGDPRCVDRRLGLQVRPQPAPARGGGSPARHRPPGAPQPVLSV